MEKGIRILVVDDHQVVREGLRHLLAQEEDMETVGQGANGEEALFQVEILSPDIVLMDIKMPGVNGIELTRQITQKHPSCKVIMLTLYDEYLTQAMEAGAKGYLLKDIKRQELAQAIRQIHSGEVVISNSITSKAEFGSGESYSRKTAEVSGTMVAEVQLALSPPVEANQLMRLTGQVEKILQSRVLQKDIKRQELAQAIRQTHSGEVVISNSITSKAEFEPGERRSRKAAEVSDTMVEEIQLVLPPPVEANQLMRLTGRMEEILQSRVLQVVGSWQEGTIITIILDQAIALADIMNKLENMPEVEAITEKPLSTEVSPKLLQKAADIPRLKNRLRKTIFVTLEKKRARIAN